VHRDVKPGNILLTALGAVKLTDFGIAKAVDAAPVTRSGMVMGTAHYIAPEQAAGQDAGPASDVYSLGVVGYECLTGHRPFLSENAVTVALMHIRDAPPPLPSDTPPGVRALIDATLVKDPRARYATGGEFAAAVAAVRAGRPLPRPGSAVLQGPPLRGGAVLGVPPLPGQGPSDDPPTGPQHRYAVPRTATVAVGPPTPIPPSAGPFVPPQQPGPRRRHQLPVPPSRVPGGPTQLLTLWILAGGLLVAGLAIGIWVALTLLGNKGGTGDNRGSGPSVTVRSSARPTTRPTQPTPSSHNVTVDADHYRDMPAADAAEELTSSGLRPEVFDQDGHKPTDATTCLVTDVSPSGAVPSGSSVTVSCRQQSG
jgi:serine/threonine-protein kinase